MRDYIVDVAIGVRLFTPRFWSIRNDQWFVHFSVHSQYCHSHQCNGSAFCLLLYIHRSFQLYTPFFLVTNTYTRTHTKMYIYAWSSWSCYSWWSSERKTAQVKQQQKSWKNSPANKLFMFRKHWPYIVIKWNGATDAPSTKIFPKYLKCGCWQMPIRDHIRYSSSSSSSIPSSSTGSSNQYRSYIKLSRYYVYNWN